MVVYGEEPRPRLLFVGFPEDDPGLLKMLTRAASSRVVSPEKSEFALSRGELRADDWDAVIALGDLAERIPSEMHALSFSSAGLGSCDDKGARVRVVLRYVEQQPSLIMSVPDGLDAKWHGLIARSILPLLRKMAKRPVMQAIDMTNRVVANHLDPGTGTGIPVSALVNDADGRVIVGVFRRKDDGRSMMFALPVYPTEPDVWLDLALTVFARATPERFPNVPDWRQEPEWQTPEEDSLTTQRSELSARRKAALAEFAQEEQRLEQGLTEARANAEVGPRRLLTAQGPELSTVVQWTLTQLGFRVIDCDSLVPPGVAKAEDIRVADDDEAGWLNITEVRGYKGGAKVSDLQRIARFALLYSQQEGKLPTSRWYIVNQLLGLSPPDRHQALQGADDDVNVFAEDGGLVIDTRDMYRLWRAVESGQLVREEARRLLRESTGRFAFDAS